MRAYFQLPERTVAVMRNSLFRQFPADPAVHLYRAHVSADQLPETGERESLRQVFGADTRRLQRRRALAWIFNRRGIA